MAAGTVHTRPVRCMISLSTASTDRTDRHEPEPSHCEQRDHVYQLLLRQEGDLMRRESRLESLWESHVAAGYSYTEQSTARRVWG
jgi:hypothetical protein